MADLKPMSKTEGTDLIDNKYEMDGEINRRHDDDSPISREFLFRRFFEHDFPASREFMNGGYWALRVNVSEGDQKITVKAEIPGCDLKDIDVKVEGNVLLLKGEKKQVLEDKNEKFHRVECAYGLFSRTLQLPVEVDSDRVSVSYEKGILTIIMGKI